MARAPGASRRRCTTKSPSGSKITPWGSGAGRRLDVPTESTRGVAPEAADDRWARLAAGTATEHLDPVTRRNGRRAEPKEMGRRSER